MQFKLVNLNTWLGGKLFDQASAFLQQESPDIITLQEVYNGTDSKLPKNLRTILEIKKLGYTYFSFSPCFQDESTQGKLDRGNAILSRFPIVSTHSIFYDRPYGVYSELNSQDFPFFPSNLQYCQIQIEDKTVNVFNTQGIWGLDGKDSKRRLAMSNTIVTAIKDKEHVILAGDFNVRPNTKTIGQIEEHLQNVFKDESKSTFNMKRKNIPGYASAVVDMIFVSRDIEVVSHDCPEVDISDHLPLICSLRLK